MANLRTALDSAFWDQSLASPQTLDGSANSVPGQPFPLEGRRASPALRIQQLSFLRMGIPFGIVPSISSTSNSELGSFSLQSLLLSPSTSFGWLGLVGQFRPKKLISDIKREFLNSDEFDLTLLKEAASHFLDKSLYSVSLCSQLSLEPLPSLLWSTEKHGHNKETRNKFMLYKKINEHDITLEAGWPQLFVDSKARYWDVPQAIALSLSSLTSSSGFRYRLGLQNNRGHPKSVNDLNGEAPDALMPGLCAKAGFSYEQSKDLWREKETQDDLFITTDKGRFFRPAYDVRMKEPHATLSAVIGGTAAAWFGNRSINIQSEDGNDSVTIKKISPVSADLFGSACYTYQHGKFRERYRDLTRFDARLDLCSASALAKRALNIFKSSSLSNAEKSLSSPRLSFIFQQQVAGPIVFRVDSKFKVDPTSVQVEDFICSLSYSLRLLESGKVVAWYSPKRKEGMVELRLFEF